MVYNVNNTMRVSGLASGMDTESIVKELMHAERMPLNKMEQDKTMLTWQRDAFRDINKTLLDMDTRVMDMKLSKTYNAKTTTSSQSDAVTATATTGSSVGSYNIQVDQLATAAVNYSQGTISGGEGKIDPNKPLKDQVFADESTFDDGEQSFRFTTYDQDGKETEHTVSFTGADTLNDVFKKISTESGGAVRAFYDGTADKVVLERTETGNFNPLDGNFGGKEIGFDAANTFFSNTLNISLDKETGGKNADITYNNGYSVKSFQNHYTLDGITFHFNKVTEGAANVSVSNNVDESLDKITEFVNKYNEMLEKVNGQLQEPKHRDFKPLTEAQKEEMSEKEIELWEEKAKSGLLKGESMLSGGLLDMRQNWYATVENDGAFSHLSQIGITTSPNYRDNGKLLIDEDKLRAALTDDPTAVQQLFSNNVEGAGRGIINRVEDSIESMMERVEQRAGRGTQTLEQYTLGKQMKNLDSRISAFESRLVQTENRYWRQFTEMEKAIQQMNNQSSYLMQQFS